MVVRRRPDAAYDQEVFPTPHALTLPDAAVIRKMPFFSNDVSIETYPALRDNHFDLIDVSANHNCGIHSVIIGLIAQGTIQQPLPSALPQLIVRVRKALHVAMFVHLDLVVAKLPEDLRLGFTVESDMWQEILDSFYDASLPPETYGDETDSPPPPVRYIWLPLLTAIAFGMPVVQYIRVETDHEVVWQTLFFDGHLYDPVTHEMPAQFFHTLNRVCLLYTSPSPRD